jgi:hypothetical protein
MVRGVLPLLRGVLQALLGEAALPAAVAAAAALVELLIP